MSDQTNDVVLTPFDVDQLNQLSTAILDLGIADSDPIDIVNNLPIVTLAPGEDGINGQSLATATVDIDVNVNQSNSADFSSSDPDEDQEVEQENENDLTVAGPPLVGGPLVNAAFADTVSVNNVANIVADGHGVNALSDALGDVTINNTVVQTNSNRLAGTASEPPRCAVEYRQRP